MIKGPLPIEIILLGCAIALVLVQIVMQASAGVLSNGLAYAMGAQDEGRQASGVYAQRITRALRNVLETFPLFAACALGVVVTGHTSASTALGAQIYIWARLIYVPVYIFGIPYVRTAVWAASIVGIVMMLIPLLGR